MFNKNDNKLNNNYIDFDDFSYAKLVKHLIRKYGKVKGNYFIDESCTLKNNKIRRFKGEGLYIHHIKEDEGHFLSKPKQAIRFPYEYQLGKNLVYCNLLEHYILHLKILIKTKGAYGGYGVKVIEDELYDFFNFGVIKNNCEDAFEAIYNEKDAFEHYYKLQLKLL